MSSFTTGIGKGLREPVSPYRSAYIFGAELNAFNADDWNGIPTVWDPTTFFDLSGMEKGHEVVVALVGLKGTYEGTYDLTFEWYRDRDNALLYRYNWPVSLGEGWWVYSYSYLGYVDWEINENGGYHVNITVTGPESFSRTYNFTIAGITEVIPPPPVPGNFLDPIFSIVWDIADAVYSAYTEVKGWVWPFNMLQYPLFVMYQGFWNLLTPIANFGVWVDDVALKVSNILSQEGILGLIKYWFPWIGNAGEWLPSLKNDWDNFWTITWPEWTKKLDKVDIAWDNFWTITWPGITQRLDIIDVAWDNFWTVTWPEWTKKLDKVDIAWDNFWTITFPTLVTNIAANELIKSAFTAREGLWAGWQDWRSKVAEFFEDPEQWVYDRLDSFFERFW